MRKSLPFFFLILPLLAAALACAVPTMNSTPTPPPSPTPLGDTIFFTAPYAVRLVPNTAVPGTEIVYIQQIGDLYELSIQGLQAYRQIGDSLTWRGIVAPGVYGNYQLRLQSSLGGQLQAEGQAQIAVFNPAPVEVPPTQSPTGAIYYTSIPVQYFVPQGAHVPGTTLVFEKADGQIIELSGTVRYPFFALDDSLIWVGKLRENVYLRYNMRVTSLNEHGLGLTGTGELWITE